MTTVIGIHQHQDKVEQLYENMGLLAAPLSAVGPFPTKGEALTWLEDMQRKAGNCEVIELDNTEDDQQPWYGFSFEK